MTKAKLVLSALMVGILTVTGASLAEARVKVDDKKINVEAKDKYRPSRSDMREAQRSPEAHRPEGRDGSDSRLDYKRNRQGV